MLALWPFLSHQLILGVAKVAQLELDVILVDADLDECVLQLDVTVGDPQAVAELHRHQKLLEEAPAQVLWQAPAE